MLWYIGLLYLYFMFILLIVIVDCFGYLRIDWVLLRLLLFILFCVCIIAMILLLCDFGLLL